MYILISWVLESKSKKKKGANMQMLKNEAYNLDVFRIKALGVLENETG